MELDIILVNYTISYSEGPQCVEEEWNFVINNDKTLTMATLKGPSDINRKCISFEHDGLSDDVAQQIIDALEGSDFDGLSLEYSDSVLFLPKDLKHVDPIAETNKFLGSGETPFVQMHDFNKPTSIDKETAKKQAEMWVEEYEKLMVPESGSFFTPPYLENDTAEEQEPVKPKSHEPVKPPALPKIDYTKKPTRRIIL